MQYILLIYENESNMQDMPAPGTPAFQAMMQPWMEYGEALTKADVMVAGEPLEPSATATCVQQRDGKRIVQDGPFMDAKEQLAGFYIVEADSLDDAIAWAEKCPGAKTGTMEVRPIMKIPGME